MLAILLFATIALQLDVGDARCIDCIVADDAANLSDAATSASSNNSLISSAARYAKSSDNSDSSFPAWIKTTLGIAVVALGLVLAGRKVISKLFIVRTQNKNHGGAKASHGKNHNRNDWKAKRAYRIHSKEIY